MSFIDARRDVAFWARSLALHVQRQGLVKVLPLKVPIELPPVGIITLRVRQATLSAEQLIACLRDAAAA